MPWLQNAPPRVIVPSLHLLGETDELFSTEELHELHELCLDRTVLTHLRGHVVPILNVAMAQRICAFIAGVLPIEGNVDARVPPLTFASNKQAQYMSAGVDAGATNAVPQAEASYDSSSLFTRIIPHNDDGLVGHVNFLLVFGVTYWHAVGPTISPKGATPSLALDGRLFDLTVPHNAGLWTLGASSHLLLSTLGTSMDVAFLMVGATDCLEPADLGFIRRKILPLVLIVLIVHALGTALSPRGPLGSLCGPRCKACVHLLTLESWFLNELVLLRMLRVSAAMLHASPRSFALAAVLFFLLHSSGFLLSVINQYVGLFVVKRGGSFRVTAPFGAPFYDPDVGLLFYACAPFIVRKDLTFRPWPQVRVEQAASPKHSIDINIHLCMHLFRPATG